MRIACDHCGKKRDLSTGHVNRSRRLGLRLFCGRRCSGIARRKHIPKSVKRLLKAAYDAEYRKKNKALLKAKKHDYFVRTYDPEKARIDRKKTMARHVEYCRQPEYRRWKQNYDRKYLAKKHYGPAAEVALLARDLNQAIRERITNEQAREANGTYNKTQRRRREAKAEPPRSRPRFRNRRHDHSAAHG